jgi:hypothetical protein
VIGVWGGGWNKKESVQSVSEKSGKIGKVKKKAGSMHITTAGKHSFFFLQSIFSDMMAYQLLHNTKCYYMMEQLFTY